MFYKHVVDECWLQVKFIPTHFISCSDFYLFLRIHCYCLLFFFLFFSFVICSIYNQLKININFMEFILFHLYVVFIHIHVTDYIYTLWHFSSDLFIIFARLTSHCEGKFYIAVCAYMYDVTQCEKFKCVIKIFIWFYFCFSQLLIK